MPRSYSTLTLDDAKRMLSAAEAKAASFGIAYNIAVVDAGGHLLAFVRQDGGLIGSIDLAIDKAVTARNTDHVEWEHCRRRGRKRGDCLARTTSRVRLRSRRQRTLKPVSCCHPPSRSLL